MKAAEARPIRAKQIASQGGQISQAEIRIQTGRGQAVIFLDTYERAQDSSPPEQIAWLWRLLALAQRVNFALQVVGSREDITFQPSRAWRVRQPLEAFSPADSGLFLADWSEKRIPPDLQSAIFELARGHPMLTEMAAELWRDGQQAGRPLTRAELQEGLEHRSAEEWLYGRIIDRLEALGDARLVAAARYGPLLRSFTMRSLNALLPEAVERLDEAAFRRFTGYAFIKDRPDGWAFHELMAGVQRRYLERQDDPKVEACHQRARDFFEERARATKDPAAARNALYHACFLEPAVTFDKWDDATFQAELAGDRAWWGELLAVMEAPGQYRRLSRSQQGRPAQRRGMWQARDYNMQAALAAYQQASTSSAPPAPASAKPTPCRPSAT